GRRVHDARAADVPEGPRAGPAGHRGHDRDHSRARRGGALAAEPTPTRGACVMAAETLPKRAAAIERREVRSDPRRKGHGLRLTGLVRGALLFVFPFYYMLIGSLQSEPNTDISGIVPHP